MFLNLLYLLTYLYIYVYTHSSFSIGIAVSVLLSVGIIAYSIMQGHDLKTPNWYDGSICEDSVFDNHRPFQVYYTLADSSDIANMTNYKICTNLKKNPNVTYCGSPPLPKNSAGTAVDTSKMVLYCGWATRQQVRRIAITSAMIAAAVISILWLIFAHRIWGKILGLVYTILCVLALVGMGWVLFTDSKAITQSKHWCEGYYSHSLCNPTNHPDPKMNCKCYFAPYSGTAILDGIGVALYLLLVIACLYRQYTYIYREEQYNQLDDEVFDQLNKSPQ
jgi:hypothetical protein